MKWNNSNFRPLLCTYRLNWARRTSWGWWDESDDTVLQTLDPRGLRPSTLGPTSRSRSLPTILSFMSGWGRNIFVSFKTPRPGNEPGTLSWKAAVLTTVTGRLGPYTNSDPIPTRTLDQLGHYQLGHYARPTRTLYQLGPHHYITNSDTTRTQLIGSILCYWC